MPILGSLSLTFMAYTGFAAIIGAADRDKDPARNLPRAMYLAIGGVLALCVSMALTLGAAVEPAMLASEGATWLVSAARGLTFAAAMAIVPVFSFDPSTVASLGVATSHLTAVCSAGRQSSSPSGSMSLMSPVLTSA